MKFLCLFILSLLLNYGVYAQDTADTTKKEHLVFTLIEKRAEFPGGLEGFRNYLSQNIKYPEVARLIGLSGKVYITCIIDTSGKVMDVSITKCLGAGYDSEAERVVANSPKWFPCIQNSRPARSYFNFPLAFSIPQIKVTFKSLRSSNYGFIFFIKGKTYSIDEAETLLGKSFQSSNIETAEHYSDEEHYPMPGKKETYLIKIKS